MPPTLQELSDLVGLPAQDVAQDQHCPLPRWQVLQCGNESQPYGLARHRLISRVGGCRQHMAVEHRFDPGHLRRASLQ
jgi:hypothetical protein